MHGTDTASSRLRRGCHLGDGLRRFGDLHAGRIRAAGGRVDAHEKRRTRRRQNGPDVWDLHLGVLGPGLRPDVWKRQLVYRTDRLFLQRNGGTGGFGLRIPFLRQHSGRDQVPVSTGFCGRLPLHRLGRLRRARQALRLRRFRNFVYDLYLSGSRPLDLGGADGWRNTASRILPDRRLST